MHFVSLNNVVDLKKSASARSARNSSSGSRTISREDRHSTPIVIFAHIPLWLIAPEWGWGTEDSAQALGYLERFGSVTVLNGHIHQLMQKVEGARHVPHRALDRLSAAGAGNRARAGPQARARGRVAQMARRPEVVPIRSRHATLAVTDSDLS